MNDVIHDDECAEMIRHSGACRHSHAFDGDCDRQGCSRKAGRADDSDRGITVDMATGMLAAIKRFHECTEACDGVTVLGDGTRLVLTCPWSRLDVNVASDRKVIGTVYADMTFAAMGVRR